MRSTASGSPSNTASTVPSGWLAAHPATPRDAAARRTESRKKTPCTRPWARTRLRTGMPGTVEAMATVEVLETDITTLEVDAIANAANTQLMHGGGVAGAIRRAAGPELERESRAAAPIGLGEAAETTAGEMPSRWVIHAATMELGGPTSADVIRRATASTLERATRLQAKSLALVAFGTGVGGFPVEEAARIEVHEVRRHLNEGSTLERVVFAVRGEQARAAFEAAIAKEP
jgi:O-acetyl-ADP-ribose deacetylase